MSTSRNRYPEVSLEGLERSENGVSVVIASYRQPADTLLCLQSLAAQTLDPHRFEVILVVNGSASADVSAYRRFSEENPNLDMRIIRSSLAGACHSLNLGIAAARMNWVTFVDDDDTVSEQYLEGLLAVAAGGVIPLTRIDDVSPNGHASKENRINDQIGPFLGMVVPPEDSPRGLSFNASKLIPTDWARHIGYDDHLASGQDIAFYGGLYAAYDFDFAMVPDTFDAVYHRSLSDDSQSRRELDFGFAVEERLDVIGSLAERLPRSPRSKRPVITSLMRAQALFTRRFLDDNPHLRASVNETVRMRSITSFPWDVLTVGAANTLVVSVCFPPYSDASAVTVAKRIHESGNVVDVLCCDMSDVRDVDISLERLVLGLVGSVTEVTSDVSFSNWSNIQRFVNGGMDLVDASDEWPYEHLYSRAMWPASHLLAAAIKLRRPTTRWVAEFSDPLSRDVEGRPRQGSLPHDQLAGQLLGSASKTSGIELPAPSSVFALAEVLPYALADEIVFTNGAQMRYMLSYCPSDELARLVESKAVIAPHPIPTEELYRLVTAEAPDWGYRATLAYFGSFYENRSLLDLLLALSAIPEPLRRLVALDVYTDQNERLHQVIMDQALGDTVKVRPTVGYLQFLNLTTKYDCLVVEDAITSQTHPENPYLPSKWSDYRGSGTAVWAFTEPNSTLSSLAPEYETHLGDTMGAVATLTELVDRFAGPKRDRAAAQNEDAPNRRELST